MARGARAGVGFGVGRVDHRRELEPANAEIEPCLQALSQRRFMAAGCELEQRLNFAVFATPTGAPE